MVLSPRIDAAKTEFAKKHSLPPNEPSTLEAFFTHNVLLHRNVTDFLAQQSWRGEKKILVGGTQDTQLDAIVVCIDGEVVRPDDDLSAFEEAAGEGEAPKVSFIFIQATGKEAGGGKLMQKISAFSDGVFAFFSNDGSSSKGVSARDPGMGQAQEPHLRDPRRQRPRGGLRMRHVLRMAQAVQRRRQHRLRHRHRQKEDPHLRQALLRGRILCRRPRQDRGHHPGGREEPHISRGGDVDRRGAARAFRRGALARQGRRLLRRISERGGARRSHQHQGGARSRAAARHLLHQPARLSGCRGARQRLDRRDAAQRRGAERVRPAQQRPRHRRQGQLSGCAAAPSGRRQAAREDQAHRRPDRQRLPDQQHHLPEPKGAGGRRRRRCLHPHQDHHHRRQERLRRRDPGAQPADAHRRDAAVHGQELRRRAGLALQRRFGRSPPTRFSSSGAPANTTTAPPPSSRGSSRSTSWPEPMP